MLGTEKVKQMQRGTYVSEGYLQFFHGWNTNKKKTDRKKNVEEVRKGDNENGAGNSNHHQLSQIQP